jgi:catechol 2,3-dioxygenase-like lactoylglutathione lyase family enzyme
VRTRVGAGRKGQYMLGHLGINVPDLPIAKRYYDALMPLVGFEPYFHTDGEFSYKPADNKPGTYLFFYLATEPGEYSSQRDSLQHLAFMVRRRSLIHAVHDHVVSVGGTIIHPPQHFPQYPGHYYATFWYDPFGIKLEAVCHHDRD